ncbi:MAG: helix-turn-helix transcriptional regulator [Polyangiaceae bacterium]|nr:helix-turn-helix transcriptional regulator [Polyangiaceae bacterium]
METAERIQALGRELRRRRALGLTRDALAAASGLTPNYVGAIELAQRDPSISSVMRLAHGLGLTAGELLGLPDLPPDAIEAAKLLSRIPPEVREPVVEALRALADWAGRRA